MVVPIVLFAKSFTAKSAFERLLLLMDLKHVLFDIGELAKGPTATGKGAHIWLVLSMRA